MLKKSQVKKFAVVLFVAGMLLSVGIAAAYAGSTSVQNTVKRAVMGRTFDSTTPHKAICVDPKVLDDAIESLENHIYVGKDGLFHFWENIHAICRLYGIDPVIRDALINSLQVTNDKIAKGELLLEEVSFSNGKNVFGDEVVAPHNEDYLAPSLESKCGRNKDQTHWWGIKFWRDHSNSKEIAYDFIQISNGSAGCAAISVFFAQAELTAICALEAAYFRAFGADINYHNNHCGTVTKYTWVDVYSVNSQ